MKHSLFCFLCVFSLVCVARCSSLKLSLMQLGQGLKSTGSFPFFHTGFQCAEPLIRWTMIRGVNPTSLSRGFVKQAPSEHGHILGQMF